MGKTGKFMRNLSIHEKQQLNEKYELLPGKTPDNRLLSRAMRALRSDRAVVPPGDTFELFRTAGYVQLWIQTEACRHSRSGSCTVCNYWNGRHCPGVIDKLIARDPLSGDCPTLPLNTCGSCLDPLELFPEERDGLFTWIAWHNFQKIIIETHADTLDRETVQSVCGSFQRQEVLFEFGIESASADTLFYCLHKRPPRRSISEIVETIHQCGAYCIANVLLGAPFLSKHQQVEDAAETIWALLRQGVDYITLFPINIKAHTLPHFLNRHWIYDAVRGGMIVDVLARFRAEALARIDVAWYGEHREEGTIPPYYCPRCQAELSRLLQKYNCEESLPGRERILVEMERLRYTCPPESSETG